MSPVVVDVRHEARYQDDVGRAGSELLEGDMDQGASVVISEWPDKAAALRFWNSDEYAEVKRLREGIADARVVVIEASSLS